MKVKLNDFEVTALDEVDCPGSRFSRVTRVRTTKSDGSVLWLVKKCASLSRSVFNEPHDIVKEVRVLSRISHENVVSVLGRSVRRDLDELCFWMPYIATSLAELLCLPAFSPHELYSFSDSPSTNEQQFLILTKSIIFQITSALAYLHDHSVAHRDMKPDNVQLTTAGCVKLLDFGVAWTSGEDRATLKDDLWPEFPDRPMYFEVSTGGYRAPELFFAPLSYDAFAVDLWSLGATIAEFFTPLRQVLDYDDDTDSPDVEQEIEREPRPFVMLKSTLFNPSLRWRRDALFEPPHGFGALGIISTIFKRRGTPSEENWPEFRKLPDASKLDFLPAQPVKLSTFLPHLCPAIAEPALDKTDVHFPPVEPAEPYALDLLHRFLVYPSNRRLRARDALRHPWFASEPPVLLPEDYPVEREETGTVVNASRRLQGKTLAERLHEIFPHARSGTVPVPHAW